MIEIYDIIEAIGTTLNKSFILHRNMKQHPKFKVYKIFEYTLYILNEDKSKDIIFTHSFTINTPSDDIISTWKKGDKDYLPILFKWFYNGTKI